MGKVDNCACFTCLCMLNVTVGKMIFEIIYELNHFMSVDWRGERYGKTSLFCLFHLNVMLSIRYVNLCRNQTKEMQILYCSFHKSNMAPQMKSKLTFKTGDKSVPVIRTGRRVKPFEKPWHNFSTSSFRFFSRNSKLKYYLFFWA